MGRTKKSYTDEEREAQAKKLFSEFLSAGDAAEALTLARELSAPGQQLSPPIPVQGFADAPGSGKGVQ